MANSGDEGGQDRGSAVSPGDAAAYIADMAAQLGRLAQAARLDVVAYLLDIARLEAATTAGRLGGRPAGESTGSGRPQGDEIAG